MFSGFTEDTIRFFLDLKFHNYPEYFHQEHDRYVETVQSLFYDFIQALGPDMKTIDPRMEIRPNKCLSRIHRDTRFSRDKSPYRDHLWLLFRREAEPRDKSLMYYFELGPSRLSWGMGFWNENREAMDLFRRRMTANPDGTLGLLDDLALDRHGLILDGTIHRRISVPTVIPARLRPWYCMKEMYIHKLDPDYQMVFSDRILKEVRADFLSIAPLYRLLRGYCDTVLQSSGSSAE